MKNGLIIAFCLVALNVLGQDYPVSDPSNAGGWIFNETMSDEFEGTELDRSKWWILGEDKNGALEYRGKWKGRAPGQFVGHNVLVQEGELILRSNWEPDYNFIDEIHDGTPYGGVDKSQPITQSCIMSEGMLKYGYLEIKMKAADAPVTSAFWTTGYRSEIDMTENFGKRPIGNPANKPESLERKFRTNIISWEPNLPSDHKQLKWEKDMGQRLSEDYHVFGFEWDRDYVKTYMDGNLVQAITRQELENFEYKTGKFHDQWVIKHAMELWIDAEVFEWYGLPSAADMTSPADHHIDYVRVWQKTIDGPYFDAYGFEGPFYFNYWNAAHKRSQQWWAAGNSAFSLTTDKAYSGDASLMYKQTTAISKPQTMYAPFGSSSLPSGSNELSFRLWIEEGCQVSKVTFRLQNPGKKIGDIDITNLPRGEWVEVRKSFTRSASLNNVERGDRLFIQVDDANVSGTNNTFYIDEIRFEQNNDQWTALQDQNVKKKVKVFPNPVQDRVSISSTEKIVAVELYTISGRLMKQVKDNKSIQQVEVSDLDGGLYILQMITDRNIIFSELISVI